MWSWLAGVGVRWVVAQINAGRSGRASRFFAADTTFRFPGSTSWSGTIHGRAAIRDWLERFAATGLELEVLDVIAGGPPWRLRLATRFRDRLVLDDGTIAYINEGTFYDVARWGRIELHESHEDTERVTAFDQWLAAREDLGAGHAPATGGEGGAGDGAPDVGARRGPDDGGRITVGDTWSQVTPGQARALWTVAEPFHALTYFAPEASRAFDAAGLRGFWRGYFAGRAAPLGPVGPAPVVAAFHGFHPKFVARAVPDVWQRCAPNGALAARLAGIDAAVRAHLGLDDVVRAAARAVPVLRGAAVGSAAAGRVLFAANAELVEPDDPHLALWHVTTLLREHRGDGHVAALVSRDVGPCHAHVLRLAVAGQPSDSIRPYRGWSADDWAAAADDLRSRGWLGRDGTPTAAGRRLHAEIEVATDRAAATFLAGLDDAVVDELIDVFHPLAVRLGERVIPYPNAVGVPPPHRTTDGGR